MKVDKKMKIMALISVLLFGSYLTIQQLPVGRDDLYINQLVYLKKDSTLFSGTLKIVNQGSYYYITFCEGIPCGESAEHQKGGNYVSKGKYLILKETLSNSTLKMISNDTVTLEYWQEGGNLPSDPYHLSILILRKELSLKEKNDNYMNELANKVLNDTRNLKYDYLSLTFANSVFDWTEEYYKNYELKDGKLIEMR
jgi:hypothetical protein